MVRARAKNDDEFPAVLKSQGHRKLAPWETRYKRARKAKPTAELFYNGRVYIDGANDVTAVVAVVTGHRSSAISRRRRRRERRQHRARHDHRRR